MNCAERQSWNVQGGCGYERGLMLTVEHLIAQWYWQGKVQPGACTDVDSASKYVGSPWLWAIMEARGEE